MKALILWLSIPFQKWIQRRGRRETVITKEVVDKLLILIEEGDILLSYEAQRWTGWFIKGFFDHAVMVSTSLTIVEAVGDRFDNRGKNLGGVRTMPLEEWLYKKDFVAVVRPLYPKDIRSKAASRALIFVGRGYDYNFTHDNERVYCSELPYLCYRLLEPEFLKEIPDSKEILPEAYLDMCNKVNYLNLIADSRKL